MLLLKHNHSAKRLTSFHFVHARRIRSGSQSTSALTYQRPYHTVNLVPTKESIAGFQYIAKDDKLRKQIQKASIQSIISGNEDGFEYDEIERDLPEDTWHESIALLSRFSNLKEVALRFSFKVETPRRDHYSDNSPETLEFRTKVLNSMFSALSKEHMRVDTLTIEHLQDLTRNVYETDDFVRVRRRLKALHLRIAVETNFRPYGDIDNPERHDFFNTDLNKHWLGPLQPQLTDLTIYCDDFFGVYPAWDARSLHFPNLKSLSLGKWSIAHEWQIKWLLSHGLSLQELYLDNCPIVNELYFADEQYERLSVPEPLGPESIVRNDYGYNVFPSLRWSTVLPRFCTHLLGLKRFGMAHGFWDSPDVEMNFGPHAFSRRYELPTRLHPSRYVVFCAGTEPSWLEYDHRFCHDSEHFYSVTPEELALGKNRADFLVTREEEQAALDEFVNGSNGRCRLQTNPGRTILAWEKAFAGQPLP